MKDYAYLDPRSAAAALRGNGDGRHAVYDRFLEKCLKADPLMTSREIERRFREHLAHRAGVMAKVKAVVVHVGMGAVVAAALNAIFG